MVAAARLLVAALALLCFSFATAEDSFVVLRGAPAHHLDTIADTHVADLISHVNNLSPIHQNIDRTAFPRANLFQSPAVNFMVALDAVTEDMLADAQTNFLNFENEQVVTVRSAPFPDDSLATLTNIMTGEEPNTHGIVGHSWKGSRLISVEAYTKNGNCKSAKIVDRIAAATEGAARVLTVSGNVQMASALGVNTEMMANHPEYNVATLYYLRNKGLVNLYANALEATMDNIRNGAASRGMTVQTAEGYFLAAELLAIESIPERLAAMPAGAAGVPDFVTVGVSSVKQLAERYGKQSLQVREALRLLDNALLKTSAQLEEMYNEAIMTQVFGLPTAEEHTFYTQTKQMQMARRVAGDNNTSSEQYTVQEVSAFQTQLWVAVAFIIAVALTTTTLLKMDMLENSLIYRTTDGPRPIQNVH